MGCKTYQTETFTADGRSRPYGRIEVKGSVAFGDTYLSVAGHVILQVTKMISNNACEIRTFSRNLVLLIKTGR
jgi:hypothetical protein